MSGASFKKPVTQADRVAGFIKATCSMAGSSARWNERAATGLTDALLADALRMELGIFGGSSGPDALSITYQGSGLKIWISWEIESLLGNKPVFEGKATIAMARLVYGIKDPVDIQYAMF